MAKTKRYWMKLLPVLIWHIAYLCVCTSFGKYTRVYCDLVYYLGIALYFFAWHEWRFREWGGAFKEGKAFWIPVILTALGMAVAFGAGSLITLLFPNTSDGMAVLGVNGAATLLAFTFVTILLPPLAEEAFFRKAIIAFDSKIILTLSAAASILLYASEHSLLPLGFLQACLWAIPLSIAYVKTKNIYVCMTAHFICNIAVNGMMVVTIALKLLHYA